MHSTPFLQYPLSPQALWGKRDNNNFCSAVTLIAFLPDP